MSTAEGRTRTPRAQLQGTTLQLQQHSCSSCSSCTLSHALPVPLQGPMPHPTNRDAGDVVPTPLLLVAMADGALRFFCFGDLRKQQVLTQPPQPVPATLPQQHTTALAAAAQGVAAAATTTVRGPAASGASAATAGGAPDEDRAAQAPLPDSDEVRGVASTLCGQAVVEPFAAIYCLSL